MLPPNSFIDESFMKAEGEPLEYVPSFGTIAEGLDVSEASPEEWDEAVKQNSK